MPRHRGARARRSSSTPTARSRRSFQRRHDEADARLGRHDHRARLQRSTPAPGRDEELVSLRLGRRRGQDRLAGHRRRGAQLRLPRRRQLQGRPGFGVFLSVGAAPTGERVQVAELAADQDRRRSASSWPDIEADPSDFVLLAVGQRHGIQGMPGLEFSGTIEGIEIDVGKLLARRVPDHRRSTSIGVSIKGNVFGGEINATLLGGILKLDARPAAIIDALRHDHAGRRPRPVLRPSRAASQFAGMGGISIRFGALRARPADRPAQRRRPGRHPARAEHRPVDQRLRRRRRVLQDAAVDRRPVHSCAGRSSTCPPAMPADQWLSTIKQQVASQ